MNQNKPLPLSREDWLPLARDLDWDFSYVKREEVFPEILSGSADIPQESWSNWEEPYKTTYSEYVRIQTNKNQSLHAVREAIGQVEDFEELPATWLSALKLYGATFSLAEFAAVIGNLRAARFGRTSAWRTTALFGALDEIRHTEIPLTLFHPLVKWDVQFDWIHRFYHSNNWVAIAARHMVDELLLGLDAVEFAIATNFVFESGFTNLQFIGLTALARESGDHMFEEMAKTIQTDEARHAQIGPPVLAVIAAHNKEYAQYLLDKWFWRSWHLFAIVTGFSMDYLTPLNARQSSFKEFMQEWVIDQYLDSLDHFGLKKPWYWDIFLNELEHYHHRVYVSAYSYRATVWFNLPMPGPAEKEWLASKYPEAWRDLCPIWERLSTRWEHCDPGVDFGVHGTAIIGFCSLCQVVLSGGNKNGNTARVVDHGGRRYIFCSEPCQWIFEREPDRYARHKDLVQRVLAGEAPGNLLAMLTRYFGLSYETWGKDSYQGRYPWLSRVAQKNQEMMQ